MEDSFKIDETLPTILLVEDDQALSRSLIRRLKNVGAQLNFISCDLPETALELTTKYSPEVCLVDLSIETDIGPQSGLDLIRDLLKADSSMKIVVLTGHNSSEYGMKAIHAGASSFNEKPVDANYLLIVLQDAIKFSKLKRDFRSLSLKQEIGLGLSLDSPTSTNPDMIKVLEKAAFAASNNQPLLITGETGTGKGLLARAIHKAHRKGSFVRFQPNYSGQDLVSSQLFGHEKGSFTGATDARVGLLEAANNGTLFIDEIDCLNTESQVILLETLQEKTFSRVGSLKELTSNFRLISATNADPGKLVSNEKLRSDFFHRIGHLKINIPPLRERTEDIPNLSLYFLENLSNRENLQVHSFSPSAISKLSGHSWPGNVRELLATVESATWLASYNERSVVEAEDIDIGNQKQNSSSFKQQVKDFELGLVKAAMKKNNDNQSQAAKDLGLHRTALRRILDRKS